MDFTIHRTYHDNSNTNASHRRYDDHILNRRILISHHHTSKNTSHRVGVSRIELATKMVEVNLKFFQKAMIG